VSALPEESARAVSVTHADDTCALSLVRRMAALLDRDPAALRDWVIGAPRKWAELAKAANIQPE